MDRIGGDIDKDNLVEGGSKENKELSGDLEK